MLVYYDGRWYTPRGEITIAKQDKLFTVFSDGTKRLTVEIDLRIKNSAIYGEKIMNRNTLRTWGYDV